MEIDDNQNDRLVSFVARITDEGDIIQTPWRFCIFEREISSFRRIRRVNRLLENENGISNGEMPVGFDFCETGSWIGNGIAWNAGHAEKRVINLRDVWANSNQSVQILESISRHPASHAAR